jgi:hypothetical protein
MTGVNNKGLDLQDVQWLRWTSVDDEALPFQLWPETSHSYKSIPNLTMAKIWPDIGFWPDLQNGVNVPYINYC